MVKEWVYVAWHLKSGPDLDQWMQYSNRRRTLIIAEVHRRIEQHNSAMEHLED